MESSVARSTSDSLFAGCRSSRNDSSKAGSMLHGTGRDRQRWFRNADAAQSALPQRFMVHESAPTEHLEEEKLRGWEGTPGTPEIPRPRRGCASLCPSSNSNPECPWLWSARLGGRRSERTRALRTDFSLSAWWTASPTFDPSGRRRPRLGAAAG